MKKFLFMPVLLLALTGISVAQKNDTIPVEKYKERIFQKFKGDFSLGYAAFPANSEIKSGLIFALEPRFLVLDQLAVGFRHELNLLFKEEKTQDFYGNYYKDTKAKVYESLIVSTEFYFTNNYKLRPFIAGGAGLFLVSSTATHQYNFNDDDTDATKAKFGGFVRSGIEVKHIRLAVEYNFVPKTSGIEIQIDSQGNYQYQPYKIKNSYIGIKAGFSFWHWTEI